MQLQPLNFCKTNTKQSWRKVCSGQNGWQHVEERKLIFIAHPAQNVAPNGSRTLM